MAENDTGNFSRKDDRERKYNLTYVKWMQVSEKQVDDCMLYSSDIDTMYMDFDSDSTALVTPLKDGHVSQCS